MAPNDLLPHRFALGDSVYAPQEDSFLLIEAMRVEIAAIAGARVLDLCCGSGVIGIAAARLGAREVVSFDINPEAVRSTTQNAASAGVVVDARQGSIADALAAGPFDVVLSNPPYVPTPDDTEIGGDMTASAWDAGSDGRSVLDPLCGAVPDLLTPHGMCVIVHSETSGVETTIAMLEDGGLTAETVASGHIPLGPVLTERAEWLSRSGLLPVGARSEMLAVIRGRR
ncbi:HemK2/MTQ2 family protein methyltransferase [Williamsia sp. M5A3_1d]